MIGNRSLELRHVGACLALLLCLATTPAGAADPQPPDSPTPALEAASQQAWQVILAGDYERGIPLFEAVLEQSKRTLSANHDFTFKAWDRLGGAFLRAGRLKEAKQTFEAILLQHKLGGTQESLAALSSLNNLARVIEMTESPQAALPLYEQAMALRERLVGPDHLDSVTVMDDYASALGEAGQWHKALPLLTRSVQLRVHGLAPQHPWTLTSQNNLAHLLGLMGRHTEALALNEQVLQARLATPGEQHPSTWTSMSNTAFSLLHLGRHEEAFALQERTLALQLARWPTTHNSVLTTRRGLARTLRSMGRLEEAESALRSLLQDSNTVLGHPHQQTQFTRLVLADVLLQARKWAPALELLQTAESLYLSTAGPQHFSTLRAGVMRASVACRLSQETAAKSDLSQLVSRIETHHGGDTPLRLYAKEAMAACLLRHGDSAKAEALLSPLLDETSLPDSELSLWADPRSVDIGVKAQLHRQYAVALAKLAKLGQGFAALEQGKARQLVAQLSERAAAQAAGIPEPLLTEMQSAQERLFAAKAKLRELTKLSDRPTHVARLQAAADALQSLRTHWEQDYPSYRRITQLPRVDAQQDAHLLPRRALLVSYLLDDDARLAAFTLDAQGQLQWHDLGEQPYLAAHVEAFRLAASQSSERVLQDDAQALVDIRYWRQGQQDRWQVVARGAPTCPDGTSALRNCAPAGSRQATDADLDTLRRHLSKVLLPPMQTRHQAKSYRQWVISPDGPLGALPWDLLEWQGKAAIHRVAISQLQSFSVLKAQQSLDSARASDSPPRDLALLALGNPSFGVPSASVESKQLERSGGANSKSPQQAGQDGTHHLPAHWPPLPSSGLELRLSAAAFSGQSTLVLSGTQANRARLLQASATGELARARHLLFATHVWYHPNRPQDSRLILSPSPNGAKELPPPHTDATSVTTPSALSPADIMGLRLRSDLTVLTACNSARSDNAPNSRSQLGFAYALQVAGNRNALLALWPVRDKATAHFTARFFQHLASGLGHASALQATKREYLRHPYAPWRSPQHWAGFVLVGT